MIKFTHSTDVLAYMPREGITIEQIKATRAILARRFKTNLYNIRMKFA